MKALVTGVKGQLGYDVVNELTKRGYEAVGVDIEEMDITDEASVNKVVKECNPDVVVHCAAWTAVDAAEDEENIPKVMAVNAKGTENIAKVCKEHNKNFMVVTQMLDSMIRNPYPTRAEVNDIYHAVHQGANALMLTGETAHGRYPVEAMKMLVETANGSLEEL